MQRVRGNSFLAAALCVMLVGLDWEAVGVYVDLTATRRI